MNSALLWIQGLAANIDVNTVYRSCCLLGAGFCMGFGAIAPAFGIGFAGGRGCRSMARQPGTEGETFKTMLIGQAITESSGIFALMVALMLLFMPAKDPSLIKAAGVLSAGICMGLGAFGPGIGAGLANAEACTGIGINPKVGTLMLNTMLIGQAVSQSTGVYALVVALLLIYVV